ncbi:MAG: 1-deoxy-D-xylulose-5-phosphate reductoisomerase [Acidobacteria bacterium]|nr:MAG: 1-deoxy-D-xylulose-5-phosphate reductoisomerase [Acidobacteriota bacterium]
MKGLCILGSTGSVGQNCLRVVTSLPGRFRVVALSAGKNLDVLARQVLEFGPELVVVGASDCVEPLRARVEALGFRTPLTILAGVEGQKEAVALPAVDFVVSASHGVTGLAATYEAILAGKRIGLASKEVLVVAGELVTCAARERAVEILPIDSEHSAVHQCLRSGLQREVRRIILTASGGPFLNTPRKAFDGLTPEQALKHPVWKMGGRITIDSSTLMNKGLEVIEAHWLFGLPPSRIDIYIHPESVIHSMIEFIDGTIMAQLSVADMRIPIQYALTYPDRLAVDGSSLSLDLVTTRGLHFLVPDTKRFPCLDLAREALAKGGAAPCALNAADEIAVEAFVSGRLRFSDIPRVIEKVVADSPTAVLDSLERVLECDRESRQRAREAVANLRGTQGRATAQ